MRNQSTINVNFLLLRSIPLDKDLKRYLLSKYRHLAHHNGLDYANAKFKHLYTCLCTYRASGNLPSIGMRSNGWIKKLLHYVQCQPQFALNFVKGLYSWKQEKNKASFAGKYHRTLSSQSSDSSPPPKFMRKWVTLLFNPDLRPDVYWSSRGDPHAMWHSYAKWHTLTEWLQYWRSMQYQFSPPRKGESKTIVGDKPVWPEIYKDFNEGDLLSSSSFERDLDVFVALLANREIPEDILHWLSTFPSQEVVAEAVRHLETWGTDVNLDLPSGEILRPEMDTYVGEIHYVEKGGMSLRPIAAPNRFLQRALVPAANLLMCTLEKVRNDATFNQNVFDDVIQSRVTTDSRFVGSVDLSAATDNLPSSWLVDYAAECLKSRPIESLSTMLFLWMARSKWLNEGNLSMWKVGQPLGTLPSFAWLGLTHNIFIESLALKRGLGHSPYRILGDDIVIFNKKLHRDYISAMSERGVPLSHHKSYSGKLTEFAGKIYVKRCSPFYVTDHNIVHWNTLFDYQIATGIRIPWRNLPRSIKNRIARYSCKLEVSARLLYQFTQNYVVWDRGSSNIPWPSRDKYTTALAYAYALYVDREDDIGEYSVEHSGITVINNRVVVVNRDRLEVTNGKFRRFYKTKVPDWLKRKNKPVSTDTVFDIALDAIRREAGIHSVANAAVLDS